MQDYTSQHYTSQDHTNQSTGKAQQLQLLQIYIIADHMQILVFTLKTTSKTATRTASSSCSFEKIPPHLIPFAKRSLSTRRCLILFRSQFVKHVKAIFIV